MKGSDVKKIRLELLLTQQEFAEALPVDIRTVQRWEKDDIKELRISNIRKINNLLKKNNKGNE